MVALYFEILRNTEQQIGKARLIGRIEPPRIFDRHIVLPELLYSRVISSLGSNHLLLWQAAFCIVIDATLAYFLSRVLGVAGIALSTSVMYAIAFCLLMVMARRTLARVAF